LFGGECRIRFITQGNGSAFAATGAMIPTVAKLGRTPMKKVPRPIRVMQSRKVFLRPSVSPRRPKSSAPNGRTAKPAAKASSAKMKPTLAGTLEKKYFARKAPSVP
jgi:hypothetical protein